jgi:sigma-B regulation protein RsbU (phosphoserine phosphatase)
LNQTQSAPKNSYKVSELFTTSNRKPESRQLTKEHYDILIVEDSFPERVRLVAILHKLGYSTKEASDGAEAIEWIGKADFSLVLTDWHMPIMSGLDLCKTIRGLEYISPYVILLTGRSSMCDLVSAMDSGADDYLVKPFNGEELRVRIQAGLRMVDMRNNLESKNRKVKQSYRREQALNGALQDDLNAAVKLQKSSLPKKNETINNVNCAFYFQPALGVAGDTFSIIPLGKQHIAFFQVDVVGHGIRAAMLSYAVSRYLHEHSRKPPTNPNSVQMHRPEKVLESLNQEFLCDDTCNDYFTIVYGVMNTTSGIGKIAQGGHPHPKLIKSNGAIEDVGRGGLPIGLFQDAKFEADGFTLDKRSKLVLYSDGILECATNQGETFDDSKLNQLLERFAPLTSEQLQSQLCIDVDRLLNGISPTDDISILCLQLNLNK